MTAPWVPPADVKVTCALCGDVAEGVDAAVDHIRVIHPDQYGDGPTLWADGGIVYDTAALEPEVLSREPLD